MREPPQGESQFLGGVRNTGWERLSPSNSLNMSAELLHRESRSRVELLPVRLAHGAEPNRLGVSVPHWISGNRQLRADLEIAWFNPGALQGAGPFGFESPNHGLS